VPTAPDGRQQRADLLARTIRRAFKVDLAVPEADLLHLAATTVTLIDSDRTAFDILGARPLTFRSVLGESFPSGSVPRHGEAGSSTGGAAWRRGDENG
jgi:hypothetical protein